MPPYNPDRLEGSSIYLHTEAGSPCNSNPYQNKPGELKCTQYKLPILIDSAGLEDRAVLAISSNLSMSSLVKNLCESNFKGIRVVNSHTELFINIDDKTAEGIIHERKPIMGIQFHLEAEPGSYDLTWVFDWLRRAVITGSSCPCIVFC